jgi:pyrroline-5-carboxylate reductase
MINRKIGIIGAGRIGEALIRGIINAKVAYSKEIFASDIDEDRLIQLGEELGISTSTNNNEVVEESEVIILAVKPQIIKGVVKEISSVIKKGHILISVAAGIPTKIIESELKGTQPRVVRAMPNIACVVGESASAICLGKYATAEDERIATEIFGAVGGVMTIPESLMDAVTGLSGSSPAFIFMIIEALADGGVHEGLDRDTALALSAQTTLGAAKMVLESGKHPEELKDMVFSPNGTTARGIRILEEYGIRAAMMNAIIESTKRAKELGEVL